MKKKQKRLCLALALLLAFLAWTAALKLLDVQAIGPNGSQVGLATLNGFVHSLTGVSMPLYVLTDWLGLVPVFVALGFAVLGLFQWIRRKSILRVDRSILALGVFYVALAAVYLLFEEAVINYRPVLINGVLEASYPSSTTLLVLCVMPTAGMQFRARIQNAALRRAVLASVILFTAFTVLGRLVSGVHWFTDILGGVLISAALVAFYAAACTDGQEA